LAERGRFRIDAGGSGWGGFGFGGFALSRADSGLGGLRRRLGGAMTGGGCTPSIRQAERIGRPSEAGAAAISASISGSRRAFSSQPRAPIASGISLMIQPGPCGSGFFFRGFFHRRRAAVGEFARAVGAGLDFCGDAAERLLDLADAVGKEGDQLEREPPPGALGHGVGQPLEGGEKPFGGAGGWGGHAR
jgi:hypothetical protein